MFRTVTVYKWLYYVQAYVTWYAISNFFVPFLVLLFCYGSMCAALWNNFKNKKEQEHSRPTTTAAAEELLLLQQKNANALATTQPGDPGGKMVRAKN